MNNTLISRARSAPILFSDDRPFSPDSISESDYASIVDLPVIRRPVLSTNPIQNKTATQSLIKDASHLSKPRWQSPSKADQPLPGNIPSILRSRSAKPSPPNRVSFSTPGSPARLHSAIAPQIPKKPVPQGHPQPLLPRPPPTRQPPIPRPPPSSPTAFKRRMKKKQQKKELIFITEYDDKPEILPTVISDATLWDGDDESTGVAVVDLPRTAAQPTKPPRSLRSAHLARTRMDHNSSVNLCSEFGVPPNHQLTKLSHERYLYIREMLLKGQKPFNPKYVVNRIKRGMPVTVNPEFHNSCHQPQSDPVTEEVPPIELPPPIPLVEEPQVDSTSHDDVQELHLDDNQPIMLVETEASVEVQDSGKRPFTFEDWASHCAKVGIMLRPVVDQDIELRRKEKAGLVFVHEESSSSEQSDEEEPAVVLKDNQPGILYVELRKDIAQTNLFDQLPHVTDADITTNIDSDDEMSVQYDGGYGEVKERPLSAQADTFPPLLPDPGESDVSSKMSRLKEEAFRLRQGLTSKDVGNELDSIIEVILRNDHINLLWIRKLYRDSFEESLLTDMKNTLPPPLYNLLFEIMMDSARYEVRCLWEALNGYQKDLDVVIEIICTKSNQEIAVLSQVYYEVYKSQLIADVSSETSGLLQKILLMILGCDRQSKLDKDVARNNAKMIDELLSQRSFDSEEKIAEILCTRSFPHIRIMFQEYEKTIRKDVSVSLKNHYNGHTATCILTIARYASSGPLYFADRLHQSHFRGRENDKTVCRIFITRHEKDWEMIKSAFFIKYSMAIWQYIHQCCTSGLCPVIVRLIAGNLSEDDKAKFRLLPIMNEKLDATYVLRSNFRMTAIKLLFRFQFASLLHRIHYSSKPVVQYMIEEEEEEQENPIDQINAEVEVVRDEDDMIPIEEEFVEDDPKEDMNAMRDEMKALDLSGPSDSSDEDSSDMASGVVSSLAVSNKQDKYSKDHYIPLLDVSLSAANLPSAVISQRDDFNNDEEVYISNVSRLAEFRGTIRGVAAQSFNSMKDVQLIGKALLMKTRNPAGIMQFLISRNNYQRQVIVKEYQRRYRRNLIDDLKKIVGSSNADIVMGLHFSPELFDAICIYDILKNGGEKKAADLLEILATRRPDGILVTRKAYTSIFRVEIEQAIKDEISGISADILIRLLTRDYTQKEDINEKLAARDAFGLQLKFLQNDVDVQFYLDLFTARDSKQLALTFQAFTKMTGNDIMELFESQFSGDILELWYDLVCISTDITMYFSEKLYRAITQVPQDYKQLFRVILPRSEIDLEDIKYSFKNTYGRTLEAMLKSEVRGKFVPYLILIIGKG